MSKKTFEFNGTNQKFEVKCNMGDKEHMSSCPVVKIYRAGIETKLMTPATEPNKIVVSLSEDIKPVAVATMFDMGKYMCKNCRFNEINIKKR